MKEEPDSLAPAAADPHAAGSPARPGQGPGPSAPAPADPDPEIAALLNFEPVARRNRRHDGWNPERQRGFIAALARMGDVDRAAQSVGRTSSGVWKVRQSAGGEGFSESWDAALDLFHARNPKLSRRGGRARGRWVPEPEPEPEDEEEFDEEAELERHREFLEALDAKYWAKIHEERRYRLAGRVIEADFCVRQLTWIEVLLDLGGIAESVIGKYLEGRHPLEVVATPWSLILAGLREDYWAMEGGPPRPPLPEFGPRDGDLALARPLEYAVGRDGDERAWRMRRTADEARNAEAQKAWEEKAKADAEAWRRRVEGEGAPAAAADGEPAGPAGAAEAAAIEAGPSPEPPEEGPRLRRL